MDRFSLNQFLLSVRFQSLMLNFSLFESEVCSLPNTKCHCLSDMFTLAVFTLEDEQIIWTDKSSQTKKLSDVQIFQVAETNC